MTLNLKTLEISPYLVSKKVLKFSLIKKETNKERN